MQNQQLRVLYLEFFQLREFSGIDDINKLFKMKSQWTYTLTTKKLSDLDVDAIIYMYGTEGFEKPNRQLNYGYFK